MRTSARPLSPASGGSHTFGAKVATPVTSDVGAATGSGITVAQTVWPSIATERGMPARSIVRMTFVVSGSTCVSVPAMGLATQIPVEVTATSLTPGASSVAPADSARPAPMRHSIPSAGLVIQAAFLPTAIDPTDPGGMDARRTTRPERSSSRTTAPSTPSTQTPAPPLATAAAGTSRIVRVIAPVVASARTREKSGATAHTALVETARWLSTRFEVEPPILGRPISIRSVRVVGSRLATAVATGPMNCVSRKRRPFATQTEPAPNAMSVGVAPVASVSTRRDDGTMRRTVRASASTSQRAPSPTASADGVRPAGICRTISPDSASIPTTDPWPTCAVEPEASPSRRARAAIAAVRSAEQSAVATSRLQRRRRRRPGVCGARSDSSWVRIDRSSAWSSGPGSRPSSDTSVCRASA